MAAQIIPLTTAPNQNLTVSLNVDGKVLQLQLAITYSEVAQMWFMAVSDASGNLLLSSIPLVTGQWPAANILAQYGYLAIGSAYVVAVGQVADDYPNASELGSAYVLLWDDTGG